VNDNRLICPAACGPEAAWAGDVDILAPGDLLQLINHIKGTQVLRRPEAKLGGAEEDARRIPDLSEVRGQESAKRALEIAAAGGHNLLMLGPPGSGKSLLAACLPGLLPELSPREALEVSMIHSLAGTLPQGGLMRARPYRDPHHSASQPAMVGGGHKAKPGEISLAHRGVLFLDELPEFSRGTIEALRQPLETGRTLIARANHHVSYPAAFQLIAAMNPCRCGYLGDPSRECAKAPRCGADYQGKISGPLFDRIDLQVEVPAVSALEMAAEAPTGESSAQVAARVAAARDIQKSRYAAFTGEAEVPGAVNAGLPPAALDKLVPLEDEARAALTRAAEAMRLSARAYHRILRVARTVADLAGGAEKIGKTHINEALSYRRTAAN
jgi:magnesium chelatase family protein